MVKQIQELFKRIDKLEEQINTITCMPNVYWAKYNKTPHKCPVCDGFGNRIYENQVSPCHSCEGKGVIWG